MRRNYFIRAATIIALAWPLAANAAPSTNATPDPAVLAAIAAAATNVTETTPHEGIGSSRLGRSIGSRSGGVVVERKVTYTIGEAPAAPESTNSAAATNATPAEPAKQ
jgi:hypothetical protein